MPSRLRHQAAAALLILQHGWIDHRRAKPFQPETQDILLSVKDGLARFKFKKHDHGPTIEAAAASFAGYIRAREFAAQLRRGPDCFRLVLDRTILELIDPNPEPDAGFAISFTGTVEGSFDVN